MISLWGLYVAESHSSVRFKHTHIPVSDLFCQSWYGWLTLLLDWGVTENRLIKRVEMSAKHKYTHPKCTVNLCVYCVYVSAREKQWISVLICVCGETKRTLHVWIGREEPATASYVALIIDSNFLAFPPLSPSPLSYWALLLLPSYLISFTSLSNYLLS